MEEKVKGPKSGYGGVVLKRRRSKRGSQAKKGRNIEKIENFPGAMVQKGRFRLTTRNITSSGAGVISDSVAINISLLTTDSAAFLARFQKYRLWKVEALIQCVAITTGATRFWMTDAGSSSGGTQDDVPNCVCPNNSANPMSYRKIFYKAVDYPDLDFQDQTTSYSLCDFNVQSVGSSVAAVSTICYSIDFWVDIDFKLFQ